MPELPEVETTRRGIEPHIIDQTICNVTVRHRQLRWPITANLESALKGQRITQVKRRAKYLLLHTPNGTAILHLGMSGSLRILPTAADWKKHDHVSIEFAHDQCLRFHDPRRFGALLWTTQVVEQHPLLTKLGPEPLGNHFNAPYLHERAQGRRIPIKSLIMDSHVVVGVGNIYANEALFIAGIHPLRAAGRIALPRYETLVGAIRQVLSDAIAQGGTTLRDFIGSDGEPGYFRQSLRVYQRHGQPCRNCGTAIKLVRQGQRATYYCGRCQH